LRAALGPAYRVCAMKSPDLHGKTALVTGAASGIGRATALALARAGADLWLCDINEAGLAAAATEAKRSGQRVETRRVDVAKREEVRVLADEVNGAVGALDILVNNAGVAVAGPFLHTTLEDWDWVVSVNLWGTIYGCHFFLPKMVERGAGGHIVNVASAAGFFATPALSAYATTKFGVIGLSESLRAELHRHNIGVTAVCPGVIDTNITMTARMRGPAADESARTRLVDFYKRRKFGPERVADGILRAIAENRAVLPVTPEAWAFYAIKRAFPSLASLLSRTIMNRVERVARGEAR
jgi:NAD(P)-dependent dehydrogenase (short-subunit alcohol dehydrogenase family)